MGGLNNVQQLVVITTSTIRLPFYSSSSCFNITPPPPPPNQHSPHHMHLHLFNNNNNNIIINHSCSSRRRRRRSTSSSSTTIYAAAAPPPPPQEDDFDDDSKFVPINDDDPSYGPPALLLLGFQPEEEASKIQQLLKDLDGQFMQIIYCTETMISDSLWNAMHTNQQHQQQPNLLLKIAKSSFPRICFLSGLTGEETLMFIDAFQESGIEAAVFAALVPNNAHTPLQELIQEIMADHEATMSAKQSSSP